MDFKTVIFILRVPISIIMVFFVNCTAMAGRNSNSSISEPSSTRTQVLANWEEMKYGMFIHFGMSTFTGTEIDRATAPSKTYAPTGLDVSQWVRVAKEAGMKYAVLVTKHISGHCLWDSKGYDYDVATSSNTTDIVDEFIKACKTEDIKPGLYYCILESYCDGVNVMQRWVTPIGDEYFDLIKHQITELHTRYPGLCEQWFDIVAKLSSSQRWELYRLVKKLNPKCIVVMNQGYNDGKRFPLWAWPTDVVNAERMGPSDAVHDPVKKMFNGKTYYLPMEVADSLSEHWFWRPDDKLKTVKQLYTLWQLTVKRGANLLLNVTPDRRGRIPDEYAKRLMEFKRVLDNPDLLAKPKSLTYAKPACASNAEWNPVNRPFAAVDNDNSTYWLTEKPVRSAWLEIDLGQEIAFDRAMISEYENRINAFELQIQKNKNEWKTIFSGNKIGKKREFKFEPATSRYVRLNILDANNSPGIYEFQLYNK